MGLKREKYHRNTALSYSTIKSNWKTNRRSGAVLDFRLCMDKLFYLKQLLEKTIEPGNIDLKEAFDNVPVGKLWCAMKNNIHTRYINAVNIFYKDNISYFNMIKSNA